MRCWKSWRNALGLAALAALGACARGEDAPQLRIDAARLEHRADGPWLVANVNWTPSAEMLEGLDHGIALTLDVDVAALSSVPLAWLHPQARSTHRLELSYSPLTRQYQWRGLARGGLRSYALRSAALSALERMEVPLQKDFPADAPQLLLEVDLDTDALPGALRLPALVRGPWRQPSARFAWPGQAG